MPLPREWLGLPLTYTRGWRVQQLKKPLLGMIYRGVMFVLLPSVDASCSGWSVDNVVSFLPAFENDLAVVLHLANVGTVVVKSHVTYQQYLKEKI